MAANNTVLKSCRAKRCPADSHPERQHLAVQQRRWELHIGYVRLALDGPFEHQWFPCSASYYTGRVGSDDERAVAMRAVEILNRDHRYDVAVCRPQIDSILRRAASELSVENPPRELP